MVEWKAALRPGGGVDTIGPRKTNTLQVSHTRGAGGGCGPAAGGHPNLRGISSPYPPRFGFHIAMLLSLSLGLAVAAYAPPLLSRANGVVSTRLMMSEATFVSPDAAESVEEEALGFIDSKPLSGPERTARALKFWSKVVPILGAYKAAELQGERTSMSEEELEAKYEELHEWGSERLEAAIKDLKGFYVKTGQVISTRVDLFPEQYTSRLASLQDDLDPMPAAQVKAVVESELLLGEPLESIFSSFDDEPLGAASIAQVHAATLRDGRKVAVKVQRPNCEPKLKGDIANLKSFSKKLGSALPVDYYTVFCELERALQGELDFLAEAQAAMKVFSSVSHTADGKPVAPAVGVPLPIQGLASTRVLVMEFVEGTPLNRLAGEMEKRGIKPGSAESKLAGRRILTQLTEAFGRMMLGAGFIHGDPHPVRM
jgi:predicted unusual protein kinase regulating ubiquinone biosynthesis (AarF/ABC1/UbiB family)